MINDNDHRSTFVNAHDQNHNETRQFARNDTVTYAHMPASSKRIMSIGHTRTYHGSAAFDEAHAAAVVVGDVVTIDVSNVVDVDVG
jgi:hypothetical protein